MTANQVVAYNLQLIRVHRGLTQDEAAQQVQRYLGGRKWSRANFSAAERSIAGGRIRNFDADEILAFARAFDVDPGFFFRPPLPPDPYNRYPKIAEPADAPPERLVNGAILADRLTDLGPFDGWIQGIELGLEEGDAETRERALMRLEDFSRGLYQWARKRQRRTDGRSDG